MYIKPQYIIELILCTLLDHQLRPSYLELAVASKPAVVTTVEYYHHRKPQLYASLPLFRSLEH